MVIARRALLVAALTATAWGKPARADSRTEAAQTSLAALEKRHGGRLGVAILRANGQPLLLHRPDERFPLCSTYKALAAGFVLARVDGGQESLARRIVYKKDDLVSYSPVTENHAGADGLTVGELCGAAVTKSDNTAANLLLDSFGGPGGLTTYLRSLGDEVTRMDRREPALNEVLPGEEHDTTTPAAMAATLRHLVLGTALSAPSRAQLVAWLVASTTGGARVRAGVPHDWRVGDKTGSGASNATHDVAVLWPPGRDPLVVTAFYIDAQASDDQRNAVLAAVGRLAASA